MAYSSLKKIITSVKDLIEIVKKAEDYTHHFEFSMHKGHLELLYRGQGRDCWKLIPKIARRFTDPEKIKKIEKAIINDFREELNKEGLNKHVQEGFFPGCFHSDWLLIQQAQHYELPTRFMDWTGAWDVALYFAVADERNDKYDGQFWIYLVPSENWVSDNGEHTYLTQDPFEYDRTIFLNSANLGSEDYLIKIAQRRKLKQMGRFCIQSYSSIIKPLEEQKQHKPYLHKVIIPSSVKISIREELAKRNITKEVLFVSESENETIILKIKAIVKKLTKKYNL